MTKPDPSTPHDHLFKAVFSEAESAFVLFRQALPSRLVNSIDPASVRLEPPSFVDDDLRELHRDLLFSAKLREGDEILLYVVAEHQSSVDALMPLRLLRYVVRVWEWWLRDNPAARRIPAVVPLVVHQGPRAWTGPSSLAGVVELPAELQAAVGRNMPALELAFFDLGRTPPSSVAAAAGPAYARLTLLFLQAALGDRDMAGVVDRFVDIVLELCRDSPGLERMRRLMRYSRRLGTIDMDKLKRSVEKVIGSDDADFLLDTQELIERGRKQGLEKGLQEGVEKGRQEGLEKGLQEGVERGRLEGLEMGRLSFARALEGLLRGRFGELDAATSQRLDEATPADLERWTARVFDAKKLADVFRKDKRSPRRRSR